MWDIITNNFKKKVMKLKYSNSGYENLPVPLTDEEFNYYYKEMKLGSTLARKKIIEHNMRLVVRIALKYQNTSYEFEDLLSIGTIGLIKSVDTFDMAKSKFSIYAGICIENEILLYIRRQASYRNIISLNSVLYNDSDRGETLEDILFDEEQDTLSKYLFNEQVGAIREFVFNLNERDREIIKLRYGFGGNEPITQEEVAREFGIARTTVSMLEKRTIKRLREYLLNLQLIEMSSFDLSSHNTRNLYVHHRNNKENN